MVGKEAATDGTRNAQRGWDDDDGGEGVQVWDCVKEEFLCSGSINVVWIVNEALTYHCVPVLTEVAHVYARHESFEARHAGEHI